MKPFAVLALASLCACTNDPPAALPDAGGEDTPDEDGSVPDDDAAVPTTDGGAQGLPPASTTPAPQREGDVVSLGDLPSLFVALGGDARPAVPQGTYPTQIVTQVLARMNGRGADFGIFLGDYMYVSPGSTSRATGQLQLFRQALAGFQPTMYFALGNHDASYGNLVAWRQLLSSAAYYALRATTPQGSVKIVFLADNLWDSTQQAWAQQQLSQPTTYTFIARHHPMSDSTGMDPQIAAFIRGTTYTLVLAGHSHYYDRRSKEVVFGNAGAPLTGSSAYYGYGTLEILASGQVRVRSYRMDTDAMADDFTVSP